VLRGIGRSDAAEKLEHVKFGKINNMSTRLGNVVSVDQMLEQGTNVALDVLQNSPFTKADPAEFARLAEKMAVGAFLINDFRRKRTVNYMYEWKKILKPDRESV